MNGPISKSVSSALPRAFSRRSAILKIVEEKALGTRLELSGLFLLFTVERIIFPDHLLDMRHFHSHFMDLWAIQNLTEISFIPCLFSY